VVVVAFDNDQQRLSAVGNDSRRQVMGVPWLTTWLSNTTRERWRPWTHLLWESMGIPNFFRAFELPY